MVLALLSCMHLLWNRFGTECLSLLSLLLSNSWNMSLAYFISAPGWMTKSMRKWENRKLERQKCFSMCLIQRLSFKSQIHLECKCKLYKLCSFTLFTAIVNCVPNCWASGSNLGVYKWGLLLAFLWSDVTVLGGRIGVPCPAECVCSFTF